ncbi:Putative gene transfer agent portal protein [Deinococcus gobiensis I-0]|uniref:Putative gene transfer agent portal protein n=2 Tax=Deinococcus TaxID=1298 RepID=H8GX88_DEIGI|nr:Putative gene transfer agent portal protein [Deinococcus gobiensis I-0]
MARQDLMERWALHMLLAGNALWFLNLVSGKPVELWPLLPDEIKPIKDAQKFVSGYEWKPAGRDKTRLDAVQVAHWMCVNPNDVYWGLSPVMAGAKAIDTDTTAARWNISTLANDGKPPYAVLLDSGLSAEQQRTATAILREQVNGSNVRKMIALGSTRDVKPLAMNATDLDWLNGRRFSREEIGAVLGVPPILMSFGEAATFSNLDAAKAMLWEDRIVPLLDDLCQGLMGSLFPFWTLDGAQWRIRPDLSGVRALQANLKTEAEVGKLKAETLKTLVDSGVPANMAAQVVGLPLVDIPGGDAPRSAAPAALPAATKARRPPSFERKDKGEDEVAARLARMDEWTGEIQNKVAQVLLEQGNAAASAYALGQPWETALDPDDWQDLLEAVHTAVIEAEGKVAYTAVLSSITATGGGGAFDVLADGVTEWIAEHVGENVKGITETSQALLQGQITAGVEAGESVKDIAKRLRKANAEWAGWRAEVIARTETASAFGAAHAQAADQLADEFDVELVKTWHATRDSRTRDEHAAIDGETRALDEPFSIGVMQSPGGVNCRCVVTYGVAE